jgi:hypothetical protein
MYGCGETYTENRKRKLPESDNGEFVSLKFIIIGTVLARKLRCLIKFQQRLSKSSNPSLLMVS